MKRTRGKRLLACVLALALFFTSGFLFVFRDSVFGADNQNSPQEPNSYVDTSKKNDLSIAIRGKSGTGNIILTDEDSNQKDQTPKTSYKGWTCETDSGEITIPDTIGAKGSETNPFVVVEVVPDKGQQELSYFVGGSKDAGSGFDTGYMSATVMEKLREYNNDPSFRFTALAFKKGTGSGSSSGFINNNITEKLQYIYGRWINKLNYRIFDYGTDNTADPIQGPKVIDCTNETNDEDKIGSFDFNELYNIEFTTDDLLNVLPSKYVESIGSNAPGQSTMDSAKADHCYYEWDQKGPGNKNVETFYKWQYTDDLIAMVAEYKDEKMNEVTNEHIEDFIVNVLCKKVILNSNKLKSQVAETGERRVSTEVVRYNLSDFCQANWLKPGVGQNITFNDIMDGGIFDMYDVSESIIRRGSDYRTRHYNLYAKGTKVKYRDPDKSFDNNNPDASLQSTEKELSNYWKVLFRKYYIDTFDKLYNEYQEADKAFRDKEYEEQRYNLNNYQKLEGDTLSLMRTRNNKLKKLMRTFQPFFNRKGVNEKTFDDGFDWEVNEKSVLSDVRRYKVEPKGGYILAVKPTKGNLYLMQDSDVKEVLKNQTEEELHDMGLKDDKDVDNLIVFADNTEDLKSLDGKTEDDKNTYKRWIFVPSNFALNGYMAPHGYHNGYLDDENYTFGFASKSFYSKTDYRLAIFDRSNRRHHGTGEWQAGKSQYKDSVLGNGTIEKISDKMVYHTDEENTVGESDVDSANSLYNDWGKDGKKQDKKHLNVWKSLKVLSAEPYYSQFKVNETTMKNNIDTYDNLYNYDGNGFAGSLSVDTKGAGENKTIINGGWMYKNSNDIRITGMCLNFRDINLSDASYDNNPNSDYKINITEENTGKKPYWLCLPDIYSKEALNRIFDYTPQAYNHKIRMYSVADQSGSNSNRLTVEDKRFTEPDDNVKLMNKNIQVRETVKKYNFTYYGFKANPILQRSLFNYSSEAEMNDFHLRVVTVTPSEMNQIAEEAKNYNLDNQNIQGYSIKNAAKEAEKKFIKGEFDSVEGESKEEFDRKEEERKKADIDIQNAVQNANWKTAWREERLTPQQLADTTLKPTDKGYLDLNVRLDLVERADMFYIHQMKTSRKFSTGEDDLYPSESPGNDINLAYRFYMDVANEGKDGEANRTKFQNMNTFFENDLEWEQVMKLIKRSSMKTNRSLPILFNLFVGFMTDVGVDATDNNWYNNAVDTHMQLFSNPDKVELGNGLQNTDEFKEYVQTYAGNVNNLGKLYTILTQFDLHAKRGTLLGVDAQNNTRVIRRTFMGDIFDKISEVPVNTSYKPSDKDRVEHSAKMTGIIPEMEAFSAAERKNYNQKDYRSRIRVLCQKKEKNSQF
ncbi:MAG: hypothetical protein IKQ97_11045 [Eubacterium sp.]|nr:hypothetical protein [Eubacterium sp.]